MYIPKRKRGEGTMPQKMLKNYVNGRWAAPHSSRTPLPVKNPGTGEVLAQVPLSSSEDVHAAVCAARDAFPTWSRTPLPKRLAYLSDLRDLLKAHLGELAEFITMENGKVFHEAEGELQRAFENATKALDVSALSGKLLTNIASGNIMEYVRREPVGVCFGITPFNFPAMIPFWFFSYALACGNTYVLKPSEQVPMTMTRIFELIDRAGFPPGVINLVHGDGETVQALLEHPVRARVSSVSSTRTMDAIAEKAAACGKEYQCQGGAKNFIVVMPDSEQEKSVPHIIESVYGNAGQRCLAGSNVVAVGGSYEPLKEKLVAAASQICVGYGLDPETTMGPVISQEAKDRITGYIERGVAEGATLLLDGRGVGVPDYPDGYYLGPTIFSDVLPTMAIAKEEIFGPVMTLLRARSLDEAIAMIHASEYGNAAMLFTESGGAAERFEEEVTCGNLGVNIGLPAPIPPFPFAGMKRSFRGSLHGQGDDAIEFFTQKKVVIKRWL